MKSDLKVPLNSYIRNPVKLGGKRFKK